VKTKRIIIASVAAAALLSAGGIVWSTAAGADVGGTERDRAGTAATQAVGGGTVLDVEEDDEPGRAYEVDVRKADGSEVEVALDKDYKVVAQEADTGDRALSAAERTSAEDAARAAISGGTVTQVEASDDAGQAYEVEVRDAAGQEWDVDLDAAFKVLRKTADS
jgi:uncharacterized membrane protein YkoI